MTRSVWCAGALSLALTLSVVAMEPAAIEDAATSPATAAEAGSDDKPKAPVLDPAVAKVVTEAAIEYLQAFKGQGLGAAVNHLHPDAMQQFKSMVMPALDAEKARGTRALLNATFGRDAGFMDARLAPPADFLARFARLISVRQPDLAPGFDAIEPIGVLPESGRMYCVLRLKTGAVERLEVVALRRDGGAWKVLLDGRLMAVAQSLAGRSDADHRRPERPLMEPIPEGAPLTPGGPRPPLGLPHAPATPSAEP